MDLDFDAARQRINDRLNQELTRIRNLPKKSKLKICNKHGLKHAHHMNTGLLKSLEVDLTVIKREERRVTNDLNKKKRRFTENTQRSFPRLLPVPGQDYDDQVKKEREFANHHSPQRFHASWTKPELPDYFSRLESLENQHRKAFLMAITEQSKRETKKIIMENITKMERKKSTNPVKKEENASLVTRLNRGQELRKSCFPSLIGPDITRTTSINPGAIPLKERQHFKANAYYKGTTFFMPEATVNSKVEKQPHLAKTNVEGKLNGRLRKNYLACQNELQLKVLPVIEVSEFTKSRRKQKGCSESWNVVKQHNNEVCQRLSQSEFKLSKNALNLPKKLNSEFQLECTIKRGKENSVFATKHLSRDDGNK